MKCAYCHQDFSKLTKEHIPPLSYQKTYLEGARIETNNFRNNELKTKSRSMQNGAYHEVVCKPCNNGKSQIDQEFCHTMKIIESSIDEYKNNLFPIKSASKCLSNLKEAQKIPIRKEMIYCFAALSQHYLNIFDDNGYEPDLRADNQLLANDCFEAIQANSFDNLKYFNIYMIIRWGKSDTVVGHLQNVTMPYFYNGKIIRFNQNVAQISTAYIDFFCVKKDSEFAQRHDELGVSNL